MRATLNAKVIDGAFKKAASKIGAQANGKAGKAANEAATGDWRSGLLLSKDGTPIACEANVAIALRDAPELAGKLRFNTLIIAAECEDLPWSPGKGWRAWTDNDDTALAMFCQHESIRVKPSGAAAAAQLVATDRKCHPVRDYLDSLGWDGKHRLDTWLHTYLGAAVEVAADGATPNEREAAKAKNTYVREVGRKWLISGVARAYESGCKADHALILEGPQDVGKSSALAALMPDPAWFADEIADLGTKDSAQDLAGKWLIEISELSALKRGEVERVKAFMSRAVDHYRPSYGRRSQDFPRQGFFGGTTNSDSYLSDETGNRRFWGVKVGKIELEKLRQARDQLWAEAVTAYRAGEKWWLNDDVKAAAAVQQAERRVVDPWEQTLLEWTEGQTDAVTISEGLDVLGVPVERRDQAAANRVARILKTHGWERRQRRLGGTHVWLYFRPAKPEPEQPESESPDPEPPLPGLGSGPSPEPASASPVSPVSPVDGIPTGYGKPSNSAAVTSVTSVTSTVRMCEGATPSVQGTAIGVETGDTGYTGYIQAGRGFSVTSRAQPTGYGGCETGDAPPWKNDGAWVRRVAANRETKAGGAPEVVAWAKAAGGTVAHGRGGKLRVILPKLPGCMAKSELMRLAREAGVELVSATGDGRQA